MLKSDRTVIHVEVKNTQEHYYYGSAAAMFDEPRVRELLGITYQTFRKKAFSESHPYENQFVIVRKGKLKTMIHDNDE